MAEIKLTKGHVAIVDDDLFEWLNQWSWHAQANGGEHARPDIVYARRSVKFEGVRTTFHMHRLIVCAPPNLLVDHMNHNTLDNRRENLRLATFRQNTANARHGPGASGFRGVRAPDPRSSTRRFRAQIRCDGKMLTLGWGDTAEEAARIYDAAAFRRHGAFAILNFPESVA